MREPVTYQGMEGLAEFADKSICASLSRVERRYPFKVSRYYADLGRICGEQGIEAVNRQFIPDIREEQDDAEFCCDPFFEMKQPVPGLVHRFADRALVIATSDCAVYCRHCTRKNTVRKLGGEPTTDFFQPVLRYIHSKKTVREVIISGGDPLLLDSGFLDWLLGSILAIPHVEVIRLGTRVPVVCPGLVDEQLADMLKNHRPLWLNTQFNHPAELTDEALDACGKLVSRGIPVSNQTVLLRGINDSAEVMVDLCNMLQKNLIRPYYVFQCDPVKGISHFVVSHAEARDIAMAVRNSVGGLSFPRFVRDIPGCPSKTSIFE